MGPNKISTAEKERVVFVFKSNQLARFGGGLAVGMDQIVAVGLDHDEGIAAHLTGFLPSGLPSSVSPTPGRFPLGPLDC